MKINDSQHTSIPYLRRHWTWDRRREIFPSRNRAPVSSMNLHCPLGKLFIKNVSLKFECIVSVVDIINLKLKKRGRAQWNFDCAQPSEENYENDFFSLFYKRGGELSTKISWRYILKKVGRNKVRAFANIFHNFLAGLSDSLFGVLYWYNRPSISKARTKNLV